MTDSEDQKVLKKLLEATKKKHLYNLTLKLITKYHFKTIAGNRSDTIYFYLDGYYHKGGEVIIRKEVEVNLNHVATTHLVSEVVGRIKRQTYTERTEVEPFLSNVLNGIIDLRNGTLTKHTPEIFFIQQLPVTFNPKSKCPEILKFIRGALPEEDAQFILEFVGFCLYRMYFIKKALIIVGEKDTGKTTLMTVLIIFLGSINVSSESLQRITKDKFSAGSLSGKLANIYDDLPYQDLEDGGGFKIATGGGYLAAEVKFGDRWQFRNFAKFIYTCNQIPKMKDIDDDAYYDRWRVIRFSEVIAKDKQDPFLQDKLTSDEEMSGFLNTVLEAFRKVFKNHRFTNDQSAEEVKAIMRRNSDPMVSFVADCLVEIPQEYISKSTMLALHVHHARINKLPHLTMTKLTQELQTNAPYIITGQRAIDNRVTECYVNVKVKDYQEFFLSHGK